MTTTDTGQDATQEIARLAADAVIFGHRRGALHVLLIRRRYEPYAGCWALPGGWVDPGEDTEAAARRELAEETGLTVPALRPSGVYADPGRDPRGRYVAFAYTTRLADTPAPTAADDAADARWLPVDHVLTGRYKLAFDHGRILHDAHRIAA
jgi:8-oxo-dGTP diphosphatase